MRYRVLPYKQGSRSAKALADALGGKVLKLQNSSFKPRHGDFIINWGNPNPYLDGDGDEWTCTVSCQLFNDNDVVSAVSNKLAFFRLMYAVAPETIPKFWQNKEEITDEDYPVVCRTILNGHSGAGIVIASNPDGLVEAPLYVKYEKKKDEYRVHCGRKEVYLTPDFGVGPEYNVTVIAVQRKARSFSSEDVNWQIRSHDNGFVFVRNNVNPPPCVIEAALESFAASSLDFGAVDVIYNEMKDRAYVLEINTAPGLEGQTILDYANYFKGFV